MGLIYDRDGHTFCAFTGRKVDDLRSWVSRQYTLEEPDREKFVRAKKMEVVEFTSKTEVRHIFTRAIWAQAILAQVLLGWFHVSTRMGEAVCCVWHCRGLSCWRACAPKKVSLRFEPQCGVKVVCPSGGPVRKDLKAMTA